jgi:hypothetical protein
VRVVGRRGPGRDCSTGSSSTTPDTDLDDPLVRAQADELLLSARRTVG